MINLIKTDNKHPDFIELVKKLNSYLATVDGDDNEFYMQFNKVEYLNHIVVAYKNKKAAACGAFKPFDDSTVEIKRMYTDENFRRMGLSNQVLKALEVWAKDLGYSKCILETGKKQVAAIKMYSNLGYNLIDNFGQYAGVENSVCFEKQLT